MAVDSIIPLKPGDAYISGPVLPPRSKVLQRSASFSFGRLRTAFVCFLWFYAGSGTAWRKSTKPKPYLRSACFLLFSPLCLLVWLPRNRRKLERKTLILFLAPVKCWFLEPNGSAVKALFQSIREKKKPRRMSHYRISVPINKISLIRKYDLLCLFLFTNCSSTLIVYLFILCLENSKLSLL